MRTLQRDDPRGTDLPGLRLGIERAARLSRDGQLSADELRAAVEADLEALGAVARSTGLAEPERQSRQATLDTVGSHLLAAVDASLSGVRPEVVADLLWRAADRLAEISA